LANEQQVLQPLLPDKPTLVTIYIHGTTVDKTAHVNNSNFIIGMLYSKSY